MADEAVYGAAGIESNKRKYDESPSPVARRATGFSSPPDSAAHPAFYNSVPPPNEIEQYKQKAQEIAARLLNADPTKRARVENGAGIGGGYEAVDAGSGHRHPGLGLGGPPPSASSYGYTSSSKKIEIPNGRVGVIIGKGGDTIKYLQQQSGAKIQVTRDTDSDPNSPTRAVELMGTPEQIAQAEQLINTVLSEAETGGSGIVNRRLTGSAAAAGAEQFVMQVANNKVGLVIGKGGETIKSMQQSTGARIQVIPLHLPPGDTSKERTVQIDGTSEQIEAAKRLIEEVTSENRMRNPSMSGGYSQQQGYQSRPQNNWSQQGPPMQQPGYGYVQPGAYPGPPQYQQSNYPGYPPASGGYAASWDQSTAPQNPQTTQGGGYDYYNQQQPPQQQQSQGGDGSGYNYSQTQAYSQGQGYGQDGYYTATGQSGYPGYDQQQQQSYNAAYSNVSNPAPDGTTPAYGTQTDTNQAPAQPSPNPSYPQQASTQPSYGAQGGYGTQPPSGYGGYGTPQGQKPSGPPAYAQPQQSPSAAAPGGGYAQFSQAPPTQPGYAQTDAGAQRPPMSGYPVPQAGYGAPPYGAQAGYGQQQAQAYSGGYGGGYSQQQPPPAAYSSDSAAAPQPVGSAKASPPS